jgi:hypothetical protein
MRYVAVLFLCLILTGTVPGAEPVDYLRDIKPILGNRCYSCHGSLRQKGGLRLDTAALLQKGGKSGPALVPGKSEESLVIDAVTGRDRPRMPPQKEGPPLTDHQIAHLRAWIDQGAKAPAEPIPEDPRKHWAFQAPVRPALPRPSNPAWVRNPIDAFIAAEHDKRGLRPRPPASRETLLRRAYLDLIGLPPTRQQLHAFLADTSSDAYEKVIEELLNSPQHGERWARHWMDVWRYSDWYGRRAVPDWWNSASQIWRWRDWIVRSLNRDRGYDRMVMEMLAADEICPEDDENLVATGYLARNWYALNPNQWMRDTVEHTGKAFLGLTLNCAHCHDHKYDPISQEEYFRFRAFFEPIQMRQDRVPGEPDPGPFQKYEYAVLRKPVRVGSIRIMDERLDAKTIMYHLGDERSPMAGKPPVTAAAPTFLGGDRLAIAPIELPQTAWYPGLKPWVQQEEVAKREAAVTAAKTALARAPTDALSTARLAAAEAELRSIQARIAADNARYGRGPGHPEVLARVAGQAERTAAASAAEEKLLQAEAALASAKVKKDAEARLAAAKKAADAARQALAASSAQYTPLSPVYPKTSTGRRRALAQWIASQENPLTARVAVNHLWLRHFGRPIVETVNDFGRNGKPPTHPGLLDWLAVELMEHGWSMKHLHRLIVTSNTYRMQSGAGNDSSSLGVDADNRWLWQFPRRRVEAEVVRDSILHTAGELDRTLGGPDLDPHKEAEARRRSLYFSIYPEDGGHLRLLDLFDAPDPCDCYRRSESLVPQQALALTNSRLMREQSRLLARKIAAEVGRAQPPQRDDAAFIVAAFEQVLTRRPTAAEQAACLEFLGRQLELYRTAGAKGLAAPASGGVTASTDPQQRAREGLVRALFNHHDFLTIR